jgi:hypothetical protein
LLHSCCCCCCPALLSAKGKNLCVCAIHLLPDPRTTGRALSLSLLTYTRPITETPLVPNHVSQQFSRYALPHDGQRPAILWLGTHTWLFIRYLEGRKFRLAPFRI